MDKIPTLLDLVQRRVEQAREDPFGNPLLSVSLAITRMLDEGELDIPQLAVMIRHLRDRAFADRAARIAAYVGGVDPVANRAALAAVAQNVLRPDPQDSPVPWARYRMTVERTRYAAVFTAHPTFSLPAKIGQALAQAACGTPAPAFDSHRPLGVTLEQEFTQASHAIGHGRDALDQLNRELLALARTAWPDRWHELLPRPIVMSSWVGYDTDGRTDIAWSDTIRLRLRMKRMQLERLAAQLGPLQQAGPISERVAQAIEAVSAQESACDGATSPQGAAAFAHVLIGRRDAALLTPQPLLDLFTPAMTATEGDARLDLAVIRAGLAAHGLSLAHTHVRLNSAQLHNVVRQRLGIADSVEDPSHRRALLGAINAALDDVQPVAIDFGALMAEQASAARLMMTVAQVVKHIDAATPVRFLIAETESGYTLLAALWLARLFGIERMIEISPLFETAAALDQGARVLEEALRSPHYRAYLQATGKLALQFGYSDSGRYVGQIAASYLVERLRLKIADTLRQFGVTGVEVILFDTHGESIGRGAHPGSLADRLKYLSPTASRRALSRANLDVREESAFQGGDGYLLFGTPDLSLATVARIAEHAFHPAAGAIEDPIYADPDFAADFFATIRGEMEGLVADAGYAALLGAFGPALIDRTGSRPAARQSDGMGAATVRRVSDLRAIPNNAILQQIGWCANTLQGIGTAAARHPEVFADLLDRSRRFRRALDLARHGLAHSDLDVLRAVIGTLDPGSWLDRAAHTRRPGRRETLTQVARALERLDLGAATQAMFRRIQADHLALRASWPGVPRMEPREMLLHGVRLAMVHRIWMLAAGIPDFSPRHGLTRQGLEAALLRLEVPAALKMLGEIFPDTPDEAAELDFAEPRGRGVTAAYGREHDDIFTPIAQLFALVREVSAAITHEVGSFG